MESSEAGKLALNLTRNTPGGVKRIQLGSRKGVPRKVIAIRADQILGQNPPVLTPRGPNILKRNTFPENKTGKVFLAPYSNSPPTPTSRATAHSNRVTQILLPSVKIIKKINMCQLYLIIIYLLVRGI